MKVLYTAVATAKGGRTGTTKTSDGALDIQFVKPKEMGGPGVGGTNPEQLFACGYAACFISTMEFLAKQKNLVIGSSEIDARVAIGPRESAPGYGLVVEMDVRIPGLSGREAEALLAATHETCPYSNATRGNIEVKLRLAS